MSRLNTEVREFRRFFANRFTSVVSRILRDVRIVTEKCFTGIFHGLRVDQVGFALGMLGYLKGFLQRRIFAQETRIMMRGRVCRVRCLIARRLPGKCFGTCRLDCRGGEDVSWKLSHYRWKTVIRRCHCSRNIRAGAAHDCLCWGGEQKRRELTRVPFWQFSSVAIISFRWRLPWRHRKNERVIVYRVFSHEVLKS